MIVENSYSNIIDIVSKYKNKIPVCIFIPDKQCILYLDKDEKRYRVIEACYDYKGSLFINKWVVEDGYAKLIEKGIDVSDDAIKKCLMMLFTSLI